MGLDTAHEYAPERTVGKLAVVDERPERHNAGHNATVAVTITADEGVEHAGGGASRGGELHVLPHIASRWINAGKAVPVDTAKIGRRQKFILTQLAHLERADRRGVSRDFEGNIRTKQRRLRRAPPWVRWDIATFQRRDDAPSTKAAYTIALKHLVRRGLVMRDLRDERRVRLTAAGRRVATELQD